MWHMPCDMWHVTHDTWHMSRVTWFMILWRYGGKGWLSDLISDKAVYRTAPATPGLLKIGLWPILSVTCNVSLYIYIYMSPFNVQVPGEQRRSQGSRGGLRGAPLPSPPPICSPLDTWIVHAWEVLGWWIAFVELCQIEPVDRPHVAGASLGDRAFADP